MNKVRAFAATAADQPLQPFEYELAELGPEEIEIAVQYCGICHSDLNMIENQWEMTAYPIVPGHEIAGTVAAVGKSVQNVKPGDRVGLGWYSKSCMICDTCLAGDHNLCASSESTIVGRHGGFGDKVRCHWSWVIPIPDKLEIKSAGPLFCGGITVFNPIVQFDVKPTERVGVIGIGGLGHMAVQFLSKWGCHVTAFTSSSGKAEEARRFGAHEIVDSRDDKALEAAAGSQDFLLVTANVTLNWPLYLNTLRPKGRLHFVGAVLEPLAIPVFSLLMGQKSVSASPLGSPATTKEMLQFCTRHGIEPQIEVFPMSKVNEALDHLRAGKARYRIVLENDF
ncbi:MAG: NAD(P)-dependent alcohol dehydrogenase [candidate division Zixibacteria bacterium]|nr:NAD(P)-dependent alcohol dehydrogenase [candidate division Zixibacteria bacterium]